MAKSKITVDEYFNHLESQMLNLEFNCGKWLLNKREYELRGKGGLFDTLRKITGSWVVDKKHQDDLINFMITFNADPDGEWPELEILAPAREKIKTGLDPLAYPLTEKELKLIHYLIDGKADQNYAVFFYGQGGSGKSTIGNIVCQLFGEKNVCHLAFNEVGNAFKRAELSGKRLWYDDDIAPEWSKGASGTFKKVITHAKDQFEEKFQKPYDGQYRCKCFFCGNKIPSFDYADSGMLRRVIYYRKDFITARIQTDEDLTNKIWSREELINFAAWALSTPIDDLYETFKKETRDIIRENNTVGKFMSLFKDTKQNYNEYEIFCSDRNYRAYYNSDNFEKIKALFESWEAEDEGNKNKKLYEF